MDIKNDRGKYWRDGYLTFKQIFSKDEIANLREMAIKTKNDGSGRYRRKDGSFKDDLLANPNFSNLIHDKRLISIASKILGGDPVYFGDSSFTILEGKKAGKTSFWHKDNTDRADPNGPDWQSKYTIIRFAIYLQDHDRFSGGVGFKPKSHLKVDNLDKRGVQYKIRRTMRELWAPYLGKSIYFDSKIGDVGVWNLRISHAANARNFKFIKKAAITGRNDFYIPEFMKCPIGQDERIAIFITMGLDDEHLARYISYMKTREYFVESCRHSEYSVESIRNCVDSGLIVKDIGKEIRDEISDGRQLGQNVDWHPSPD